MALVKKLERITLAANARHKGATCTYSIVAGADNERLLQIDTYGSAERKMRGKKSQSIRFSREAMAQLKKIIQKERL